MRHRVLRVAAVDGEAGDLVSASAPAHADALTLLEGGDAGAALRDDADDLVSGHHRILHGHVPIDRHVLALADAAGLDLDEHLVGVRLRDGSLGQLERARTTRDLNDLHGAMLPDA